MGGLIFSFQGGLPHWSLNPLEKIDFTDLGGISFNRPPPCERLWLILGWFVYVPVAKNTVLSV